MNNGEVINADEMINKVFANIKCSDIENGNEVVNAWNETIEKIYNYGPKLAGHTHVVDIKNGTLLVETDHPGWSQILQNNKAFILKGLKMNVEGIEIKNLVTRVKGTEKGLCDDYETYLKKRREQMLEETENNEKELEKRGFKYKNEGGEVPDEVKHLFDGIFEEAKKRENDVDQNK